MPEGEQLPEDLKAYESALVSLVPKSSSVDRDRLMFRLGQLAAAEGRERGQSAWPWKLATAASLLVSLGLAARLATLAVGGDAHGVITAANSKNDQADSTEPRASKSPLFENQTNDADVSPLNGDSAWITSLARSDFELFGTLSVRPSRNAGHRVWRGPQETRPSVVAPQESDPAKRAPILRWGDREVWNEAVDIDSIISAPAL